MAILTPNTLWPPLVKVCIAWLKARLSDVPIVYDTTTVYVGGQGMSLSDAVAAGPGVVQVIRTPGGGSSADDLTEYGSVDIYFYAGDAGAVEDLAGRGKSAILQLSGRSAAGWRVDNVRTEASPGNVPYSDPTIQRWVGSFQLETSPQQ